MLIDREVVHPELDNSVVLGFYVLASCVDIKCILHLFAELGNKCVPATITLSFPQLILTGFLSLYNNTNRRAPTRVKRHRSRLRGFDFKVDFCPGEKMPCNYGSRHPPPNKTSYTKLVRERLGIEEEDAEISLSGS